MPNRQIDQSQSAAQTQPIGASQNTGQRSISLVWADYDRLAQVITNLIGNALKLR
ncbi:hypothetical protein IPG36_06615 [bacterium]|nr:MAG: hypothetical protein IPG36_06615 [bacterium]